MVQRGVGVFQINRTRNSETKILQLLSDGKSHRYKDIVKKTGLSTATVSKHLKKLEKTGIILKTIDIKSGKYPYPVSYALSPKNPFTEWWIKGRKELKKKSLKIDSLEGEKKLEALNDLVNWTVERFEDFVPWAIHYALQEPQASTTFLDTFWGWTLYQYMIVTVGVCVRNQEEALKIKSIKEKIKERIE